MLGGGAARAQRKANKAQEHQVGYTLGNYDLIKEDEDYYAGYSQDDKGFLVQFESVNEAKFITNNKLFQQLVWKSNLLHQEPSDPFMKSVRFENDVDDKPSRVPYDDYGFEIREEISKSVLPVFIPFHEMKSETEKEPGLLSKVYEYYIFHELNGIINKD